MTVVPAPNTYIDDQEETELLLLQGVLAKLDEAAAVPVETAAFGRWADMIGDLLNRRAAVKQAGPHEVRRLLEPLGGGFGLVELTDGTTEARYSAGWLDMQPWRQVDRTGLSCAWYGQCLGCGQELTYQSGPGGGFSVDDHRLGGEDCPGCGARLVPPTGAER